MRIGIDCTSAGKQRAGIGRFTRGLIRGLASAGRQHEYILIRAKDAPPLDEDLPANFKSVCLPLGEWPLTVAWHRLSLPVPLDVLIRGLDVFHATDYLLPPLSRAAGLVTVHDLSFKLFPECAEPNLVRFLERRLPRSLNRARIILADSQCTKEDLVRLYGLSPTRIAVVMGGVDDRFHPVAEPAVTAVRQKYALPGDYVLTVGTLEPRKNLVRLVEAFAKLQQESTGVSQLVIAGGKGWLYDEIFATVQRLELTDRVRFLGFVPDDDLPALLTGARLFVFPSLYEGFGLPPLEAMACGTPVVCSRSSSLPEVVGDAAIVVEPLDPAALAKAMNRVVKDGSLRAKLSEQGRVQAAKFTWKAAAESLIDVYERCGAAASNP